MNTLVQAGELLLWFLFRRSRRWGRGLRELLADYRQMYVDIEFDNSLANVVLDHFGFDVMMRPETEDSFRISRRVEISPAFYGWLFQFGDRCRLLSPAEAREEYLALARSVSGR